MASFHIRSIAVLLTCIANIVAVTPSWGDTVLITGANSGIGLEFAKQYAERGWIVIATHRRDQTPESLATLTQRYKNVSVARMDVESVEQVHALAKTLKAQPIDVLINNAGIFSLGSWLDRTNHRQRFGTLDYGSFDQFMEINVRGPLLVSEAFIDNLRAGHAKKIITISSTIGSLGTPSVAVNAFWYGISKTAVNKAMVTLSAVLKPEGIIVIPMHPGSVRVEKQASADAPGMIDTDYSVSRMIATIDRLTIADTGQFTLYDGSKLPW